MDIRQAILEDAPSVTDIYNHYIRTSHATFELEPIDPSEMRRRIQSTINDGFPFLVVKLDDLVAGYTYARQFRPRPGYSHAVEVAVYVKQGLHGKRLGGALYTELFGRLFENGAHTLIATIALPNDASVRLHEKLGFEKAGHFREVGRKFGRWVDVGYWQLLR
jgi:phosphinothricin acetyltransferase